MRVRRSIFAPAAVLVTAVVTGGWFLQRGVDRDRNVYFQVRLFEEVVDHVASQFVEDVDRGELYESAIDGLLDELGDPNTSFIRASDYETFRIQTEGDYGGVGLEILERDGFVTVVSPIPGTPGARAGLRAGDRFVEIDGQDARGWDSDRAVEHLRGKPGTDVQVKIRRTGVDEAIPFTLTRAEIHLKSVPFATLLDDGVGYVPLQIFRQSSADEVRSAVDSLRARGMRALVLDLRNNPGGLLEEGIGVSDLFLEPGAAVVETRGRGSRQSESYAARRVPEYGEMPVVVLIDELSASASEIVAGALQDQDRALVVGNVSYGKGSVQTLYRLSGGNVLRLTTAKWYTPVGRSIQMDHDAQRARLSGADGALTVEGRLAPHPDLDDRPVYESRAGRQLYGGGGITPDVIVLPDTLRADEARAVRALYRQAGAFNTALFNYVVRHLQEEEVRRGFQVDAAALRGFYQALPDYGVEVDRDTYRDASRYVAYQLEREMALRAWGEAGQFEQTRRHDLQLARALELLDGASSVQELLTLGGDAPDGVGVAIAQSSSGRDEGP